MLAAGFVMLLATGAYLLNAHVRSEEGMGGAGVPSIVGLTIYYTNASEARHLTDANLAKIEHYQVAPDTVRDVFGACSLRGQPAFLKGSLRLCVARLADGSEQRLGLANYGGFFMVMDSKRWYTVGDKSVASYCAMIAGLNGKAGGGADDASP